MARNVEIKARVTDVRRVTEAAEQLADGGPVFIEQADTFFGCGTGRLKLRELGDGAAELIFYDRRDASGPKTCEYIRVPVGDAPALKAALAAALGIKGTVRKRRTLYLSGPTRIHLDDVDGLGTFLELEVVLADGLSVVEGEATARRMMTALGITESELVEGAYLDLVTWRQQAPNAEPP